MFEFIHYARINGDRHAFVEEKWRAEWHIQNASFWLDIRVILRTGCEKSDSKHADKTPRSSRAWADWSRDG
jgi:lipopolysaccharide/colanic/teichoic acid biosynthesis glycosyltransferase